MRVVGSPSALWIRVRIAAKHDAGNLTPIRAVGFGIEQAQIGDRVGLVVPGESRDVRCFLSYSNIACHRIVPSGAMVRATAATGSPAQRRRRDPCDDRGEKRDRAGSNLARAWPVSRRICRGYSVVKYSTSRCSLVHVDTRGAGAKPEALSSFARIEPRGVGAPRRHRPYLHQFVGAATIRRHDRCRRAACGRSGSAHVRVAEAIGKRSGIRG